MKNNQIYGYHTLYTRVLIPVREMVSLQTEHIIHNRVLGGSISEENSPHCSQGMYSSSTTPRSSWVRGKEGKERVIRGRKGKEGTVSGGKPQGLVEVVGHSEALLWAHTSL